MTFVDLPATSSRRCNLPSNLHARHPEQEQPVLIALVLIATLSMTSLADPWLLHKLSPEGWKSLGYQRVNYWIRFGSLGISASVFLAWQYAFREQGNPLAHSESWRWLDRRLPARALKRTQQFLEENFLLKYGDEQIRPWTLITSAFSHKDLGHFTANTLAFNSLCNLLQFLVPPLHFVGLVLTTGIAGSAGWLFHQSRSKFPNRRMRALGMSGITSGMGIATAVLAPQADVSIMGFSVPIWVGLGGYAAWDVALLESENSKTGHAAHLGGALAGLIYAAVLSAQGVGRNPLRLRQ